MNTQQNGTVWADGTLRGWPEVTVPLMSDAVLRAVAVFEGIRADRGPDGRVRLLGGRAHVERLLSSARALRIRIDFDADAILAAAAQVAGVELDATAAGIAYVRPMALGAAVTGDAVPGATGPCSLTIAAFAQPAEAPQTVRMQLSAYRRPAGDALPAQVKAVANYQLTRLARIAARAAGYDDAVVLNAEGRVAEAAGAALLVERDGQVYTPPAWDGCLPSITVDIIERIAAATGVPFNREPVPLSALHSADGIAIAGTLADVVDVVCLDDLAVGTGSAIAELRRCYRDAMSGGAHEKLLGFVSAGFR